MHPRIEVMIDGQPVAGGFYERLVRCTVTDKEGISSDTFDMELDDGNPVVNGEPVFLAIPKTGAVVDIRMGYVETGLRSLGSFTVDKITVKCLPYSMSISGKAADLRKGKLKERQERHWDKKRVSEIVEEVAKESGLKASIDPEIGDHEYGWMAQQDESNIHFLERLAQRHNALFSIKNGHLIFAKRGSGNSASGAFVGSVVVTQSMMLQGSCSYEINDKSKHKKVKAYYQDKDKAERVEVDVEDDDDGDDE